MNFLPLAFLFRQKGGNVLLIFINFFICNHNHHGSNCDKTETAPCTIPHLSKTLYLQSRRAAPFSFCVLFQLPEMIHHGHLQVHGLPQVNRLIPLMPGQHFPLGDIRSAPHWLSSVTPSYIHYLKVFLCSRPSLSWQPFLESYHELVCCMSAKINSLS